MENKNAEKESEYDEKYPEPPELRKAGFPPLMKLVRWFAIGLGIALIIVLIFSIYYYFSNQH